MKIHRDQESASQQSIDRRNFLKASVGGAAGSMLAPTAIRAMTAGTRRPNILYINSHDSGRFTSPYGFAVPTPHLQRLAREGVLFRQAYCAAPTCSPSRAALLTGECAHSAGMLGLAADRGFYMKDYSHVIIHTLRKYGYYSIQMGEQHISPDASRIGYDKVIGGTTGPVNTVEHVTPSAIEFLKHAPKQPFYLEVGYFETHREYRKAGPQDDWRYIQPPPPIPDVPATRHDMANYHATVRKLDWAVGEVMAALDETGLADNTLVISTTDHGIGFPNMKCFLYDGGMGVHLVMRGPGGFTGGKVCDAMVSHIDIFPTICDLLKIPHPNWLQGNSFLPAVQGNVHREVNDAVFAEVNYHAAYEPKRAVRTKRWKYIRHFGGRRHPVLCNVGDSLSKTYWLDYGWAEEPVVPEELYDLVFDPNERNNLVKDPSHRDALEEMRKRLDVWMHKTNDPLLHGPVKAPPGATANDPDEISPHEPVELLR